MTTKEAAIFACKLLLDAFPWVNPNMDVHVSNPGELIHARHLYLLPFVEVQVWANHEFCQIAIREDKNESQGFRCDLSETGIIGAASAFSGMVSEFPWASKPSFLHYRLSTPLENCFGRRIERPFFVNPGLSATIEDPGALWEFFPVEKFLKTWISSGLLWNDPEKNSPPKDFFLFGKKRGTAAS